ncbi:MAG: amidohydrolase family protein [Lachnospiraceae bacterium]|nr:amidohydrolase family protein [Lachnospiraceae bacterium]
MEKIKYIDCHAHVIPFREYEPPEYLMLSMDELLALYDDVGVEKGILLPLANPEGKNCVIPNGATIAAAKAHPDRFLFFCDLDPRFGSNSPTEDLRKFLVHFKGLGARGIGELTANLEADGPYLDNLFSVAEEMDMPVTIHISPARGVGYGIVDDLHLPRLDRMLTKHPRLKVFGHSQPFWAEISADVTEATRNTYPKGKVVPTGALVELLRKHENLYCDCSAGSACNAMTRDPDYAYRFIEEFGDRMFFGIDQCKAGDRIVYDMTAFLQHGRETGAISEENYYNICRGNIIRVLKLEDEQ